MTDKAARDVLLDYAEELGDKNAVRLLRKREQDSLTEAVFDFSIALARDQLHDGVPLLVVNRNAFWTIFERMERFVIHRDPVTPRRMTYGARYFPVAFSVATGDAVPMGSDRVRTHEDLHSFVIATPCGQFRIAQS